MEHTAAYLIGMAVGIIFVVIGLTIIKRRNGGKGAFCDFDERQELVRGRAFKYGFFTLLLYFIIAVSLGKIGVRQTYFDSATIIFMGICLGIMVFTSYAIWHDAYFSMQDKPRGWIILFVAMFFLNMVVGLGGLHETDTSSSHGLLGEHSLNFCVGAMCAILVIVTAVRQIMNRRQGEDE